MAARSDPQSPRLDGRTARSLRTREAIVDALFALLQEDVLTPTVDEIAARAGVSPRTVFQHFTDREVLFAELASRQAERVIPMLRPVSTKGSLEERVDAVVDQRRRLFDVIGPMRRSAILAEPFSPTAHKGLAEFRAYKRGDLARIFHEEIAEREEGERPVLTAALGVVGSFSHWESLRSEQELTADEAETVVRHTLQALLKTPEGR